MPTPRWLSVEEALVAAHELRRLLGEEATALLDVEPRPDHVEIIAATLQTLNGPGELAERVKRAEEILRTASVPGGIVDPQDDQSDLPWCILLRHLREDPNLGSSAARGWVRHLMRLRHEDHAVSVVLDGTAAYAVAWFEWLWGRTAQYERWMLIGANATAHEDRLGLSVVAVVRAALLLGDAGRPVPTRWKV